VLLLSPIDDKRLMIYEPTSRRLDLARPRAGATGCSFTLLPQHLQVLRDSRLRERNDRHDLAAHAGAARREHVEDLEPRRMPEGLQAVGEALFMASHRVSSIYDLRATVELVKPLALLPGPRKLVSACSAVFAADGMMLRTLWCGYFRRAFGWCVIAAAGKTLITRP
jgi:hypothetical protein